MQKFFTSCSLIIFAVGMILSSAGCQIAPLTGAPVDPQGLKNGVYEGKYRKGFNKVVVKVTIADGQITDVALVKHTASWIGRKTDKIIPQRILDHQSTRVDAISGATNSSRVIMNAVQQAIEKAYQ